MARLSYFSDSATHLQLVQDIRQFGGYINLRPAAEGGMQDYPAAWAGNFALLVQWLIGDEPSIDALMQIAAFCIVACYAVLDLFAVAVALDIVRAATGRVHPVGGLTATVCIASITVGGVNVFLLEGGFLHPVACDRGDPGRHLFADQPLLPRPTSAPGVLPTDGDHDADLVSAGPRPCLRPAGLRRQSPQILAASGVGRLRHWVRAYPVMTGRGAQRRSTSRARRRYP